MSSKSSRPPEWRLKVLNKKTERKSVVGAGWSNDDGSVTIVLNDFVVLPQNEDTVITLFPIDK